MSALKYKPYVLHISQPPGPILAQLRIAKQVRKKEMARHLDCNPDTITRYENNPSTIPLETAMRYCAYLGIELSVNFME